MFHGAHKRALKFAGLIKIRNVTVPIKSTVKSFGVHAPIANASVPEASCSSLVLPKLNSDKERKNKRLLIGVIGGL